MRALRKFGSLLAACIAAAAALAQPAAAADLRNDPLIRDALNRANFEPGGKYHLFGSRGTVAERTGQMTISPTVTQQIGNLQIRQATIFSNPGYIVRFSGHGHEVHAPFDNSASRSASVKQGSVLDGFTMYQMSWDGYEHHPADGYDGPQGGGYPAPQGARDIYAYVAKGKAQSIKLNPTDTRSTEQRFADRFGNIPKNFSDRANEANKKMFEHNPNLSRWGNAMEFINGVAAGAVNPFIGAGEALGVNDAVQGVGFGIDLATMAAISPMSAEAAMSTVGGLGRLAEAEKGIGNAVRDWTAENPNAVETVEAALNAAAAAKAAKLAQTGAGKAAVSEDFADSYATNNRQHSMVDGEMFQGKNIDFKISSIGTKIHDGAQGKHILGHNNYISGKSVLDKNVNPQELLNGIHSGIYPVVSKNNRGIAVVDFGKPIGVDQNSGLRTNFGSVHSSKKGVHIVPYNPNLIKKVR